MNTIKIICFLLIGVLLQSCDEVIIKPQQKDVKVILTAPVDRLVTPNRNQSFNWITVTGTENYQLQIASPNFSTSTEFFIDTLIMETSINITLKPGVYQWCVNALQPGGFKITSDTNKLTIH